MNPGAVLSFLPAAAALLGAASAGLYLGVLMPRLGGERSAWRVLKNLEDFRTHFGREGREHLLWKAFLLLFAGALLLGLVAMALQVRILTAW